jgi:biotin carboxyl carrier protein
MPQYNIMINNRLYEVDLVKREGEGNFKAKVNNKSVKIELEKNGGVTISSLKLKIGGKRYHVELEKVNRQAPFALTVNGVDFNAQLREKARRIVTQTPVGIVAKTKRERAVFKEGVVASPMAGKIVSVRVKKGDRVHAGDVVCILEAMKMENEITAAKAGKVVEVHVTEGSAVNDRDVLVVIE